MTTFLSRLLGSLSELLHSKKAITTAATLIISSVIKDPTLRDNIIHTGMVLVGAQGAADFGKYAKDLIAKTPPTS